MEKWQQSTAIDARAYEYVVKKYFYKTGTFSDPVKLIDYLRESVTANQPIFGVTPQAFISNHPWDLILELIECELEEMQKTIYDTIQTIREGIVHCRKNGRLIFSDEMGEWTDIYDRGYIHGNKSLEKRIGTDI